MPSMVIGALFGRALGMMVQAWQASYPGFWMFAACSLDGPCITPGSYAMVGAAAFMGGVTRMTVSLVIIMFELTGALTYVLPIMIVGT
jgi:chloride channel 3/4/5